MMSRKIILSLLFYVSLTVYGQNETNNWYFGTNAGISFNSGVPVVLNGGQMNTLEGCSTISDSTGSLLFYTDGNRVWNKLHQIMPNGSDLLGNFSSTQSALIVPNPSNVFQYYVFTTADLGGEDGLRYSIVDLSLNNGLGDITSNKNISLATPVAEKLSAVKNAADDGYWLIAHEYGSDNFISYAITASGVNLIPVVSSIGAFIGNDYVSTMGQLKLSPDGSKLISCSINKDLQLFDFDSSTGIVSNMRTLNNSLWNYAAEFSPSGEKLYVTSAFNFGLALNVLQYDITEPIISESEQVIFSTGISTTFLTGLQLASDGKIYMSINGSHFLSAINNPEGLGLTCNLVQNAVFLGSGICQIGLPQFVQSNFNVNISFQNTCLGDSTLFSFTSSQNLSTIDWNFGDGNTSDEINPTHIYESPGLYNVTVNATSSLGAVSKTGEVFISEIPTANTVPSQQICAGFNASYSLLQNNIIILGGQSDSLFGITYHATLSDAENNLSILSVNQNLILGENHFFARVYNMSNPSCSSVTSFTVHLSQLPIENVVEEFLICNPFGNSLAIFDLDQKKPEILWGMNSFEFEISFHLTEQDAIESSAEISNLYENLLPEEVIFYRVENIDSSECFIIGSFSIAVRNLASTVAVSDLLICSNTGNTFSFLPALKEGEILSGQSTLEFNVTYHTSENDALANIAPILGEYENAINPQQIFYRVTTIGSLDCFVTGHYFVNVSNFPNLNNDMVFHKCNDSENNNNVSLDLSEYIPELISNFNEDFDVKFFNSELDAMNNMASINGLFEMSTQSQFLYVRAQSQTNPDCFSVSSFQIEIDTLPMAYQPTDIGVCGEEGFENLVFNLQSQSELILQSQSSEDYSVTYHASLDEATNGSNPLPYEYENTTNPQIIYGRVGNKANDSCFSITSFNLNVHILPDLISENEYVVCENNNITVNALSGFNGYEWSNGATDQSIVINDPGSYWVKGFRYYGDLKCEVVENISVSKSSHPIIYDVLISDWTKDNNSITVIPSKQGSYQYSIDGMSYQTSPYFINLDAGVYTVYLKDDFECSVVSKEIVLLNYPIFFTPNSDGFNDYWRVKFSSKEPMMKIHVFDRFGKLLYSMMGADLGWDGKFNGRDMPSSDYWFLVERTNGKEYRGHFALVR